MRQITKRALPLLPVLFLVLLTAIGLANALQSDDEEVDFGPQATDFRGDDGEVDIAGYLIAVGAYDVAPPVPVDEEVEFRVFGCAEGEPITISIVPRGLLASEQEANDALAADDTARLLEEPVVLVEEDAALAEPATYVVTVPEQTPNGFARLRVECTGADGEPLETDTVIDVVVRADFEAAQADADEPEEIVTILDGGAEA